MAAEDQNPVAENRRGDLPGHAPELVFGHEILAPAIAALPRPYALVAQPEPLGFVPPVVTGEAAYVGLVTSLEEAALERLDDLVPPVVALLGLGGGTAMDSAKYLAWRRGVALFEAPSALSVDACVTNTVAIRAGGRVEYRGFVTADRVLVDFDLVQRAPVRMNRAGLGDLLSIHTALWDWHLAAERGLSRLVPAFVTRAETILDRVESLSEEVREVSDRAGEAVVRAYLDVNDMVAELGHAQVEEGSEHYFVYCLEQVTGRPFVHGEVVSLGTILMAFLQGNRSDRPRKIAERAGVQWEATKLGISHEELSETLRRLPSFVRESSLSYSVINEVSLDEAAIDHLVELAS
ncbi:MAG TPA: iron-containing alcohol dehydrogenase [Candidatus Saccharimonadales bacterium]|nr:iron-containing alcohol dehydrogenase [Candidatus Saccharimonadales bacterium]